MPEALTSDRFNEHTDCVMAGHSYCTDDCCEDGVCILCGYDVLAEEDL